MATRIITCHVNNILYKNYRTKLYGKHEKSIPGRLDNYALLENELESKQPFRMEFLKNNVEL